MSGQRSSTETSNVQTSAIHEDAVVHMFCIQVYDTHIRGLQMSMYFCMLSICESKQQVGGWVGAALSGVRVTSFRHGVVGALSQCNKSIFAARRPYKYIVIRLHLQSLTTEDVIVSATLQGHDEPFLEQWHQKLHQNTTPEDVTICEAYLAFLHSGNHDDYWRVLWDNGRMTKEYLENMNNPIKCELLDVCVMHVLCFGPRSQSTA